MFSQKEIEDKVFVPYPKEELKGHSHDTFSLMNMTTNITLNTNQEFNSSFLFSKMKAMEVDLPDDVEHETQTNQLLPVPLLFSYLVVSERKINEISNLELD